MLVSSPNIPKTESELIFETTTNFTQFQHFCTDVQHMYVSHLKSHCLKSTMYCMSKNQTSTILRIFELQKFQHQQRFFKQQPHNTCKLIKKNSFHTSIIEIKHKDARKKEIKFKKFVSPNNDEENLYFSDNWKVSLPTQDARKGY